MSSLQAFPRADGSVGIRNIVLVVSTVTCANTVVNHIAWKTGAVPLTHERGCVEGEQSFRRTMLALTTFAKHPNVSGVLIVGLGCEQIRTLDLQVAIGGGKPCTPSSFRRRAAPSKPRPEAVSSSARCSGPRRIWNASLAPCPGLLWACSAAVPTGRPPLPGTRLSGP